MSTEQKLSLSLDSLIEKHQKGRGSAARRRSGSNAAQRRGSRGKGPPGTSVPSISNNAMVGKRHGKAGKKVDPHSLSFTVKVGGHRKQRPSGQRRPGGMRKSERHGKWDHGGFHSMEGQEHGDPMDPSPHGTKLVVSNLHEKVSTVDIGDLFRPIGPLISYRVHYDVSDASQGTAHIIFEKREHAVEAMEKYNGVLLDDMPMNIELIEKRPALADKMAGRRPGNVKRSGAGAVGFQKALAGALQQR